MRRFSNQRGTVIIIVLWTAALLTVLVTAMTSKVRLSAKTVVHNHEAAVSWAELMGAVSQAEMELMMENMARPVGEPLVTSEEGEIREQRYRFNGQPLNLHYPVSDDIVVRIYNHAGKINLNRIERGKLRQLIEVQLGGREEADPDEVEELMAAWTDWTDLNDLASTLGGAESDYYQSLEPGYAPRNSATFDTVDELLLIRGFAELFGDVNLEAAFTIYGNERSINLNLATREALQLLPGMDDDIIERILAYREVEDINNRQEINELIPYENLVELGTWIGNQFSQVSTVYVYPKVEANALAVEGSEQISVPGRGNGENGENGENRDTQENGAGEEHDNPDPVTQAYMEIVEVRSFRELPTVMKVDPYGYLPDTAPPRVELDNSYFD